MESGAKKSFELLIVNDGRANPIEMVFSSK